MITVEHLRKEYPHRQKQEGLRGSLAGFFSNETQTKTAVNDISFHIEQGEIVGFLGPNGAGKTTVLKMLSGIMYPTSGRAEVLGYVPWERKNNFKRKISIVLGQKNQLWWDLPASESLRLNQCIYDIPDEQYRRTVGELSELLEVKDLLDVQVRNLSLGERMKMELMAALLHRPQVIFLDEPTIGLDIVAQKRMRDFLKQYNEREHATVMLTSHYLEDIRSLCRRTIVLNHGNIVYDGLLDAMNEKMADRKIIRLRTEDALEENGRWQVRTKEKGSYELEVRRAEVKDALRELLARYEVRDVSIEDIPLEESLAVLYAAGEKV